MAEQKVIAFAVHDFLDISAEHHIAHHGGGEFGIPGHNDLSIGGKGIEQLDHKIGQDQSQQEENGLAVGFAPALFLIHQDFLLKIKIFKFVVLRFFIHGSPWDQPRISNYIRG